MFHFPMRDIASLDDKPFEQSFVVIIFYVRMEGLLLFKQFQYKCNKLIFLLSFGYSGKDLYSRNLKLLVPFFDHPSIALQKIEKGSNSETKFVLASWKLRTYLKLPWRPLISIAGSTVYDLNDEFKIVRHAESWNISALQAVGQIFTPSLRRLSE
ncbi:hypothetical protein CK203_094345 [Vitis vinifera]|uniref:Uncharacterized protein n=1 Tax=Vitis vinifera TaxID=29760 RepID=A0A438CW95_VITVI|nr:hypothetical protein CK203_094345 [Vitis vinifera]